MTDYFALLEQPRSPWLDPENLKQVFHQKTLRDHPDAQAHDSSQGLVEANFADVNEAYRVLRDPKRRLHHLLTLEKQTPSSATAEIPREIEELFSVVAALTRKSDEVIQRRALATTALGRSLMKGAIAEVEADVRQALARLSKLHSEALTQLHEARESWTAAKLHALYLQFSYLTRWMSQLEEKRLQLNV